MTNQCPNDPMTKPGNFVIGASSLIGHSDFDIRHSFLAWLRQAMISHGQWGGQKPGCARPGKGPA
jgi:hypothetical protein